MPQPMKAPEPAMKRAQTMFADDDLLPDDMPIDMPHEAPKGNTSLANRPGASKGLPTAKVDTGDVALHAPAAERMGGAMANQYSNFLAGMNPEDEEPGYDEEEVEPVPPVEETLPAIIQNALSVEHGEIQSFQMANIIKQAPPALKKPLEKIGRDIFSSFSKAPKSLKDIYTVSSFTNSTTEIQLMLAWVLMHGRKLEDPEIDFPSMPGYAPRLELWEVDDAKFLLVRETPEDFQNGAAAAETIEDSFDADYPIAENVMDGAMHGQRPDPNECLYYVYGWDEPKGKLGDGGLRAGLLESAMKLAKKRGDMTVREAYEELIDKLLFEDVDYEVGKTDREEIEGKWMKDPATKPKFSEGLFSKRRPSPINVDDDLGEVDSFDQPTKLSYSPEDWKAGTKVRVSFTPEQLQAMDPDTISHLTGMNGEIGRIKHDKSATETDLRNTMPERFLVQFGGVPSIMPGSGYREYIPWQFLTPVANEKAIKEAKPLKIKNVGSGEEDDVGDVDSFQKPTKMEYVAKWQEYDRGPAPLITIKFKASSDEAALKKIFLKKVVLDEGNASIEDWCEEQGDISPADINLTWLNEYFDQIDTGGWPFLDKLTNTTTGVVVYDMGNDDYSDDEDWDDDDMDESVGDENRHPFEKM